MVEVWSISVTPNEYVTIFGKPDVLQAYYHNHDGLIKLDLGGP